MAEEAVIAVEERSRWINEAGLYALLLGSRKPEAQTNGVSLEAQEAKIQAWCTLHDAALGAIYRDEGISG